MNPKEQSLLVERARERSGYWFGTDPKDAKLMAALADEIERLAALQKERGTRDVEEAEARCCPEDVGFEEWISVLKRKLRDARSWLLYWSEPQRSAPTYREAHDWVRLMDWLTKLEVNATPSTARRITPARLARLKELAADPSAPRRRGNAGYNCMALGWTDWLVEFNGERSVERMAYREMCNRYPAGQRPDYRNIGEMLTESGRAALNAGQQELDA